MAMAGRSSRFLDGFFEFLFRIAMAALGLMMLVVVADVTMRYLFNSPIRGSYDLVEMLLPVMVFFGMPSVIASRQEIVIDLIDGMVSSRFRRWLILISSVLAFLMIAFVIISMLDPARQAYEYGDVKLELAFPIWILWVVVLFGMVASLLATIKVVLAAFAADPNDGIEEEKGFE
jgi:TRAP-type transport system small permease protein